MLEYASYDRLCGVLNSVKPYRGSDRYPMANRTHRGKYMIPKKVNDKIEFHVCYWWRHEPIDISEAEYNNMGSDEQQQYHNYNSYSSNLPKVYRRYEKLPNVVAIVRDDNTVEFTAEYFGQGDRGYLSSLSHGWFSTCHKKGGGLYRGGNVQQIIFKGLRLNINTHEVHESCDYNIITRVVDREKAKDVLEEYDRPFKIAEAMIKGYSLERFFEDVLVMKETVDKTHKSENLYVRAREYKTEGVKLLKTDEVGGCMLLMIHKDHSLVNRSDRYVRSNVIDSWTRDAGEPVDYFYRMRKNVHRDLYIECNALKERIHKHGDHIPSSTWEISIRLNGEAVNPY